MNRDDPRHHQGQYRGHHQNRRYNRGEREGSFKSHYESGSWLENQKRKPLFQRSAAGWHKTTHIRDWNKPRRPLGQSQELPPGALPKPVPPPPTKPLPTSEELFQEKIKQTSGSLLKQMEECPDAELVLPSRNSMDCQMKEDTNENILPAISYLQAEADATAAELSASKKKAKKAALHAQQGRVREIVQIVRQLKRQERLQVSRDIRDMHNKTRNIDECDNINALVPDISVQLNVLPDECIAIISSILNSDLEPLPEPTDAPVIIQDSSFNVDNSNSGGNEFYDPFEYDICDNSSQESSRFDAVQEPPHHALHTYPESNTRENNFDDDSRSPTSVDIKPEPEYIRTYKYHIKPGRAESRGPNKFKLKRDLSNDNGHSFNNTRTTPQPVPHPTHSTRPYNQRSQRSPTRESKHFRSQVKRHEKTPPPLIIGPQIASVPQRSPSPTFDNPHNESRKIRVIKEAHEVFNRTVHTSKPVEGDTNERHAVPNNDKTVNEVSKTDVNGISEENDILFREKFDLGSSDEDDWNRNLILKSKERVLREIAEEEAKVLRLALKNAEAKTQSNVHNGFIESNTRDSVRSMEEDRVQMETEPVKTPTLPLQTHVQCTEEELDYDPRFSDSEEERIQVECTEQIVDDSTREVVESITEKSDTNLPESPKDKAVTKPDGTPVIVLEATSKPGTYKAKQGKLVNEHMYCKNVTSTEDASENQLDKSKPNEVSEGIQTEDLPVTTVANGGEKSTAVVSKPDTSHSHKEKHKRSRSKSSSSTKHAKTSSTSRYKSKSDKTSSPKSKSHTDSASSASTFSTSKKNTIEQAIASAHEEKDKTILGRLRARYQRYKKHSRAVISKLENIDREMRKLLDERRNIYKEFHAFVSTSESEEDMPHGEEHAKRRLSETGTSQNSPSQHSSDNPSKKKPVKYIIISEGDSTPSKHLNPVLNSDTPNELVLTQVLHDNPEDIPNPDSPPNFLMPSMDVDIFSMFSEPQNKPPFNEPVVAQEAEEEQLGEDSDSVPEAGTTEMQIDLGGVMNISQTMPTDFLEPSDNECMGLQRMKRDISHKSADSFLPFCNNNVKIEESDVGTMEVEVNSEYGNEVNTEASDGVVDYIGWKDSILVIKIVKDLIVAGNDKGKLFLFDTKSAFPIFTETICLNEAITAMDVYENGSNTRLFIGSQNQNLYVYDIGDRRLLRVISVGTPIQCLELMWMSLFIGSSKGELIRFSLANGRITAPEKISESAVLAIKGSMDGSRRVLVVALRNAPISIRDASSCLELRTIGEDLYSVYSIVLFHNRVYCGTSHDDVLVYNFHDGQLLLKHGESRGSGIVNMIIVRNVLFVACYNGKICIYNTTDNSFITSMTAPSGLLLSMAIANKKLIAGTKQNFQCMPLPESVASLL